MDRQRFNEIMQGFLGKEVPLMMYKGADYSTEEEALKNFLETAQYLDVKPSQVALTYMLKHLSAIKNVVESPAPDNLAWSVESSGGELKEGVLQKISDARNYLAIIAMCLEEESGVKCEF